MSFGVQDLYVRTYTSCIQYRVLSHQIRETPQQTVFAMVVIKLRVCRITHITHHPSCRRQSSVVILWIDIISQLDPMPKGKTQNQHESGYTQVG
jgi:hypothetical protein